MSCDREVPAPVEARSSDKEVGGPMEARSSDREVPSSMETRSCDTEVGGPLEERSGSSIAEETEASREKAFTSRMMDTVGKGYLTLGLALGSQLGLFDVLAAENEAMTAGELAAKCGCKERYVREWLCMMAAESIVTVDKAGERFLLPPAHREGVGTINFISTSVTLLAQAHLPLLQAFKQDGPSGLTSEQTSAWFTFFQSFRPRVMAQLVPQLLDNVKGIKGKLESGLAVCVIGCDRGAEVHWLAAHYPNSTFTGIDICTEGIKTAKELANQKKVQNCHFQVENAENLPMEWANKFDYILVIDTFHDIPRASVAAKEFHRILRPGGILSILDILAHSNPADNVGNENIKILYSYSLYSCLSTSLATEGSEGLGTCAGVEKFTALLQSAGFDTEHMVTVDIQDSVHMILTK